MAIARPKKNKKCELPKCRKKHNGAYGSGRFCSEKCARSFSTKKGRKKINKKISKKLTKKRKLRVCENKKCKKKYIPKRKRQRYCGVKCARQANITKASNKNKNVDWSAVIRKQYADGTRKPSGGGIKKYKYKDFTIFGKFELRTCHILDSLKTQQKIIDWEYTDDRIPYDDLDGGSRTYFPDFKVWDKLGTFYIEVKGIVRVQDPIKWTGALLKGHRIVVWQEKEIKEYEKDLFFKVKI